MTCHSANSAHFVRRHFVTWPRCPKCRSGSVHRLRRPTSPPPPAQPPASQQAALISLTALAPRSFPAQRRMPTYTVHGKRRGDCLQVATALPANSAGSAIVADQGQEVCLERRPFPLAPSPPTPLRRSSLAAAAKRPLAVSVGSARPNSQRLQLVSRTAVRLVTGEPRGGDVFTSRLS